MPFFNKNFAGMGYGYPLAGDDAFDGYPLGDEQAQDYAPSYDAFDSDAPIAGPSRSQDWYHNPSPEGYTDESGYQGRTLLDTSGNQFVDPYPTNTHNLDAYTDVNDWHTLEQTVSIPAESAGPSMVHMATTWFRSSPTPPPPATSSGPIFQPPALHYSRDTPLSTAYTAGPLLPGTYEQPLAGPSSASQWSGPYPTTSVDKGKARATDQSPSPRPESTGEDAWRYPQLHATQDYGISLPHTVPGVPQNTDAPTPIASSSGPQRSGTSAKGKGKATQKGKGRRKRGPSEPLPEGVDSSWEQTKDRFVWKLLEEYHLGPAGRSLDPEEAFANIEKHIKEDLHRSPLAAQAADAKADKRESRVFEQYLIHVLKELRRSGTGETENELLLYTRALEELESELAPVNGERVLRGGHSSRQRDPSELEGSRAKVRHRTAEKGRRAAIRSLQDRMSVFFLVQGQRKVTIGELLLFVVIYLRIGEVAFPGLIHPRTRDHEQQE